MENPICLICVVRDEYFEDREHHDLTKDFGKWVAYVATRMIKYAPAYPDIVYVKESEYNSVDDKKWKPRPNYVPVVINFGKITIDSILQNGIGVYLAKLMKDADGPNDLSVEQIIERVLIYYEQGMRQFREKLKETVLSDSKLIWSKLAYRCGDVNLAYMGDNFIEHAPFPNSSLACSMMMSSIIQTCGIGKVHPFIKGDGEDDTFIGILKEAKDTFTNALKPRDILNVGDYVQFHRKGEHFEVSIPAVIKRLPDKEKCTYSVIANWEPAAMGYNSTFEAFASELTKI